MKYVIVCLSLMMAACGGGDSSSGSGGGGAPAEPVGVVSSDDSVIKGRAVYQVDAQSTSALLRLFNMFQMAYAATGTTTVTYTNAASVSFQINIASFGAGSFTGSTLSLGTFGLSDIDDNHLKVCNPGGNTKCTKAAIRVYTTGSVAGFVHTTDSYGAPVYAGTLNPTTEVGLNTAGSVQVQQITIASNKNRLRLSDFPSPTYGATSDFSNAGSGSYSMTFVVEYILLP